VTSHTPASYTVCMQKAPEDPSFFSYCFKRILLGTSDSSVIAGTDRKEQVQA